MTKEENVFFCKIAVHNKLVSLEDANACLREASEQKMDVGDIFLDEELLSESQVKQISDAVKRKLGKAAQAAHPSKRTKREAAPASAKGRKGAKEARRDLRPGSHRKPVKKVNQTQMIISISSLVVLALVIVLTVFFWTRTPEKPTDIPSNNSNTSSTNKNNTADLNTISTNLPSLDTGGIGNNPPKTQKAIDEAKNTLNQAIIDGKADLRDEQYAMGIKTLEIAIKKCGDDAPKEILEQAENMKAQLLKLMKEKEGK